METVGLDSGSGLIMGDFVS